MSNIFGKNKRVKRVWTISWQLKTRARWPELSIKLTHRAYNTCTVQQLPDTNCRGIEQFLKVIFRINPSFFITPSLFDFDYINIFVILEILLIVKPFLSITSSFIDFDDISIFRHIITLIYLQMLSKYTMKLLWFPNFNNY